MKFFVFLLFSLSAFAEPYSYSITEHPYLFTTYFEMQGKNGYEGRGVKSLASLQTVYELYDTVGNFQAKGVVRTLSLGAVFVWGKDIDIYDPSGKYIGFINGEVLTTANAKYSFYDENNKCVAIAYLDYACSGFLVTSKKKKRTLAHLKRNFVEHATDHWVVTLYEPESLDVRLLKIFSIFAIDYQEYFKEDK